MRDRHTSAQRDLNAIGYPSLPAATTTPADRTAVHREFKLPEMTELAGVPAMVAHYKRKDQLEEPRLLAVQPLSGKFDCQTPHAGERHGQNCLAYVDPREVNLTRLTSENGDSASVIAQRVNCLILINDRKGLAGDAQSHTYHGDLECKRLFGRFLGEILRLPENSTLSGSDGRTYTLGELGEFNEKLFRKVYSEDLAVLPVEGKAGGRSRHLSEVQGLDEYGSEEAAMPAGYARVGMDRIRIEGNDIKVRVGAQAIHSIWVRIPVMTDTREAVDSKMVMKEIARIIAELPLTRVEALSGIHLLASDNDSFTGQYRGLLKEIILTKSAWRQPWETRGVFYHEFGHAMADRVYGSTYPDASWSFAMWNDKPLKDTALGGSNLLLTDNNGNSLPFVADNILREDAHLIKVGSGYALTDRQEDYAETVEAYLLAHEEPRDMQRLLESRQGLEFRFSILDRQCASLFDPLPRKQSK